MTFVSEIVLFIEMQQPSLLKVSSDISYFGLLMASLLFKLRHSQLC